MTTTKTIISNHVFTYWMDYPRAIAIVLGPLGSTHALMDQLASFYTSRNCAVVVARSPPHRFFFAQHGALQPVATQILHQTSLLVQQAERQRCRQQEERKEEEQPQQQRSSSGSTTTTTNTAITTSQVPVVVHMFSNGGTFLLEEMDRPIHRETTHYQLVYDRIRGDGNDRQHRHGTTTTTTTTSSSSTDTTGNANGSVGTGGFRGGYLFFDSCPCYLHMIWDLRSKFWNDAFPFPTWMRSLSTGTRSDETANERNQESIMMTGSSPTVVPTSWIGDVCRRIYFFLAATSLSAWCLLSGSLQRSHDFWTCMSKPPFDATHLVYMYSTNDKVTDASRIDELIEHHQQQQRRLYHQEQQQQQNQQQGNNDGHTQIDDGGTTVIRQYRYEDAGHVNIYHVYPEEYNQAIDDALDIATRQRG